MSIGSSITAAAGQIRLRYGVADRVADYAQVLRLYRKAGFALLSLAEFDALETAAGEPPTRCLVLRHDVDIRDPAGNEAFRAAEAEVGAHSTFYFRWSTVGAHERLVRRLLDDGFEVGYHYEEGATIAKRRGLASRVAVADRHGEIADLVHANCAVFRARWNPGLASIASHGDWINRRLGFANHEFVTPELLEVCGLRFEAYGPRILGRVDAYVSDVSTPPARWLAGDGPADIQAGRDTVCMLTHERRWHPNRRAGVAADLNRSLDEVAYRIRRRRAGSGPRAATTDEGGRRLAP